MQDRDSLATLLDERLAEPQLSQSALPVRNACQNGEDEKALHCHRHALCCSPPTLAVPPCSMACKLYISDVDGRKWVHRSCCSLMALAQSLGMDLVLSPPVVEASS